MMINSNTPNANAKFSRLPKSLLPTPPAISLIVAGTSVTPITVTTDPIYNRETVLQAFQIISQK